MRTHTEVAPHSFRNVFDSMLDMVDAVKAIDHNLFTTHCRNAYLDRLTYQEHFIGRYFRNWDDVYESIETAWTPGVLILDRMLEQLSSEGVKPPTSLRRRQSWKEDDGDEIDVERLRRGQPAWLSSHRAHRPGPQTATICTNMSTSCDVPSDLILWRGAAAVCLTKLLEEANYRVELWAVDFRTGTFTGPRPNGDPGRFGNSWGDVSSGVCLKRPNDPLDVSTLISAVSGWSYRTLFLAMSYIPELMVGSGHGNPREIDDVIQHYTPDGDLALTCTDVWNFKAAIGWVKNSLEMFH